MEGQAELSRRVREDDEILRDLLITKRNLQTELQNYERTRSKAAAVHVETLLEHRDQGLELTVRSTHTIHAVVVFAEGVFQHGESHVVHAPLAATLKTLAVPLFFKPNVSVDLQLKIIVSDDKEHGEVLHVHEMTQNVPSFASLKFLDDEDGQQFKGSLIKFRIQERLQRVLFWLEQSFVFSPESAVPTIQPGGLRLSFRDVRSGARVCIEGNAEGYFVIRTSDLDLAGDLVHSLCSFLKVEHLAAEIELCPSLNQDILSVFQKIQALQSARKLLSSGFAQQVNQVLGCRSQLQNSFLLLQMDSLQMSLRDSRSALELLQNESEKCAANHSELLLLLKQVNQLIQRTAKCRVGRNQTEIISKCRTALKDNDLDLLIKILTIGF